MRANWSLRGLGGVGGTYAPRALLNPYRVLLLVCEERAGDGGYEVAWRDVAEAGPDAERVLRMLRDQRVVDCVPGEDVYRFACHGEEPSREA